MPEVSKPSQRDLPFGEIDTYINVEAGATFTIDRRTMADPYSDEKLGPGTSIRLEPSLRSDLESKAALYGTSFNNLVRSSSKMALHFSPPEQELIVKHRVLIRFVLQRRDAIVALIRALRQ